MNKECFDNHARSLRQETSRRGFLRAIAAALGLTTAHDAETLHATKRKRKPLRFNELGCINVGKPCRGNDTLCCSGICEGRRPRKGKQDRSRCIAHDATSCQSGHRATFCGGTTETPCTSAIGRPGVCQTTTGNAGYCAGASGGCSSCTTDVECQIPFGNPQGACIRCAGVCATGRACAFP